jgi:hypothetical protein
MGPRFFDPKGGQFSAESGPEKGRVVPVKKKLAALEPVELY